jgi:hypothetical protein
MLRKLVTAVMGRGYVGNRARCLLRHRAMRIPTTLAAGLLALSLFGAACSDDDTGVEAGGDGSGGGIAPDGTDVEVPDRPADLVGTVTSVTPFEPITEDCTPAEEVDPDAVVSNDDPPICTPADNDVIGTILVEELPDSPSDGRKISYTVTSDTAITGETADGVNVGGFADFAEGQAVDTWVAGGMCAESYPEQCGLEAVTVTG